MNKIFSFCALLSAAVAFSGCVNEEKDLFNKSAAERLNEASALYSSRLTASPNGWAVQLYPTTKDEAPYGNGYLLLFRFHANKSVDACMNNSLSGDKFMSSTSTWDVITDNGPVLSFDTYNDVVHTFSNPEDVPSTGTGDDPNDETGTGIGGDYEFIIVDAPEDASYMMLKGKKRGTYNLLTPVEEGVDYEAYLSDVKSFQQKMFPSNSPTFDVLHAGDSIYKFDDASDGIPNIYPYDKDKVINESFNPFLITKRGNDYYFRFRDAKAYGGKTVQDFKYDNEQDRFVSVDDASCYISGDDPLRFFDENFTGGSRWTIKKSNGMSESVQTVYDNVYNGFRSMNRTLTNISIVMGPQNVSLSFAYRTSKGNGSTVFNLSYQKNEDGVTYSFVSCNSTAQTALEKVPAIQNMLDFFCQKLSVSAGDTGFNLRTLKLSSASNANDWLVISL